MKRMISWLIGIEQKAMQVYEDAADVIDSEDPRLAAFLRGLAKDEAWHFHIMASAADFIKRKGDIAAGIELDPQTKQKIEKPFIRARRLLAQNNITREQILDLISQAEQSEWNPLFLFVINTLKQKSREFRYVAALLQSHIQSIADFFANEPGRTRQLEALTGLPRIWRRKILVVEDDVAIAELLETLLSRRWYVETAGNGEIALKKATTEHFDVILSDINMPVMDGLKFYRHFSKVYPYAKQHFIFITGNLNTRNADFLKQHKLPYLLKPAPINEIQKAVRNLLQKLPTNNEKTE